MVTLKPGSQFHKSVEKQDESEKDLPLADHFICRPKDEQTVQQLLEHQLRLGGGMALGYRKLRFVPTFDRCHTDAEKAYYKKAVKRQRSFKNCAAVLAREGIADLDSTIETADGTTVSLQDVIETYPRKDGSRTTLFIRCEWMNGRDQRVGLAISPSDYVEARNAADSLLPYCRHHYGEASLQWFTIAEQRLREHDVWDPNIKGVARDDNRDDNREAEEDAMEQWELLEEDDEEEIQVQGDNPVDRLPDPQSIENRAMHGRADEESLESLRELRNRGSRTRQTGHAR